LVGGEVQSGEVVIVCVGGCRVYSERRLFPEDPMADKLDGMRDLLSLSVAWCATSVSEPERSSRHVAEDPRILEELQPRPSVQVALPLVRCPRPLPHLEAALRVRHHRKMAAICGAHSCDTLRRPVRVERVRFCDASVVIDVTERREAVGDDTIEDGGVGEVRTPLTVGDPYPECGALHA